MSSCFKKSLAIAGLLSLLMPVISLAQCYYSTPAVYESYPVPTEYYFSQPYSGNINGFTPSNIVFGDSVMGSFPMNGQMPVPQTFTGGTTAIAGTASAPLSANALDILKRACRRKKMTAIHLIRPVGLKFEPPQARFFWSMRQVAMGCAWRTA